MRVVHLTDLHVQIRPKARELMGKRLAATANLYLLGRRRKFSEAAQQAAVLAALEERPDVVVITGDLTAQATVAEFEGARQLLAPILDRVPTVLIPGNHDTYVQDAVTTDRMGQYFGQWMGPQGRLPYLVEHGDVAFLAIESCRAHLLSSGRTPPQQLDDARALLAAADWDQPRPFVFLLLHYPLRARAGGPYGPSTRALTNAAEVEAFLTSTDRVDAVLHGHEHHGFRSQISTAAGVVPILNPGASGYAFLPDQDRTAHFNVYEVDRDGLHSVTRHRFDGTTFAEEPGGAYATGR